MNVLIISSSSRHKSLSLRFSNYLQAELLRLIKSIEVEVVNFESFDFPFPTRERLNRNKLSDFQQQIVQNWEKADLVFFCLPEYNWTTNGEVLLLLEQLGTITFADLFDEKVFAMIGISSGRGGRMPALEVGKIVEKLISFLDKIALVSPKIFEAHEVGLNLDTLSKSTGNPIFNKGVEDFISYTIRFFNRWIGGSAKEEVALLATNKE